MLGVRRKELARDRVKSRVGTKVSMPSDDHFEVVLKNSISLTSSSSYESLEHENAPKVTGFMKHVAPSVVTKYINMKKMDFPFNESKNNHGNMYEKSIFKTALAIKTGKVVEEIRTCGTTETSCTRSVSTKSSIPTSPTSISSEAMNAKRSSVTSTNTKINTKPTSPRKSITTSHYATSIATQTSFEPNITASTKLIRRQKRNAAMTTSKTSSLNTSNKEMLADSTKVVQLTPLQRRVLKVKKFQRDHKASLKEPVVEQKQFLKIKQDVVISQTNATRSNNSTVRDTTTTKVEINSARLVKHVLRHTSKEVETKAYNYNTSVDVVPATKEEVPMKDQKGSKGLPSHKTNANAFNSNRQPLNIMTSDQELPFPSRTVARDMTRVTKNIKIQKDDEAASRKIEACLTNTTTQSAQVILARNASDAPFDENTDLRQERVEVVAVPCKKTNTYQSVVIDRSRDMYHTVSEDVEEMEASRRRMELVKRARLLVESRSDPMPCLHEFAV